LTARGGGRMLLKRQLPYSAPPSPAGLFFAASDGARLARMNYRLCLRGPTGRIAKVRRFWASTDEGATAMAREMLAEDPTLIGFDLYDGTRQIAQERRREGSGSAGKQRQRRGR